MPAISLSDAPLVLVSGANGYVAMHVVGALLVRGYCVRGVVRAEWKAAHIRETFARFANRLEVVVVADIVADGAFRDALVGVDAIAHLAAYVGFSVDDPQGE
jgi:nucleoside-diphosphate-sugar epimerase